MKLYFLSGMGADKRVFQFLDLSFCEPVFIDWIKPNEKESLESYALRIREKIPEENPSIAGLSFGGMLTAEIAKRNSNIKAVIISSCKTFLELPAYFKAVKNFRAYRALPHSFIRALTIRSGWLFGAKGREQLQIFKSIIQESNLDFDYWALDAIAGWKNATVPANVKHIHGTADLILPYRYVHPDYTVKNGAHLMVMNNHAEISSILKKIYKDA